MGRSGRGKTSPLQVKAKKEEIDEIKNTSLTLSRSRRTPKPNPKYLNDQIVTLKKISSSQSSSSNEDTDNESENDSEEEKSQKNEQRNRTAKTMVTRKLAISLTPASLKASKLSTINKSSTSNPVNKSSPTTTTKLSSTVKPTSIPATNKANTSFKPSPPTATRNVLKKLNNVTIRKINASVVEEVSRSTVSTPNINRFVRSKAASTPVVSNQVETKPIAKISSTEKSETPEKRVLRKRKLDDEDFEINASSDEEDEDSEIEEAIPLHRRAKTIIKQRKIETKIPSTPPESKLLQLMREGDAANKIQKPAIQQNMQLNKPSQAKPPAIVETNTPTFTIVNINDIIKKAPEVKPVLAKPQIMQNKNIHANKTLHAALRQAQVAKQLKEAQLKSRQIPSNQSTSPKPKALVMETTADQSKTKEDDTTDNLRNINRRKAIHTTILTDDFEAQIQANAVSKIAPNEVVKTNNKPSATSTPIHILKKGGSLPLGGGNGKFRDDIAKPAQRILNSTLGKNKVFQSPLLNEQDLAIGSKSTNLIRGKPGNIDSKENNSSRQIQSNKSRLEALMNSNPKVVFENQGGTRVKKITCFETWYVINIPNNEFPIPKPQVMVSLISLGNTIKEIDLPSSDWTYRINLVKVSNPSSSTETYKGDLQDQNIKESDKGNYEPASIIFRRANINRDLNMQYDRAITFKNRSYFLNVDGKSVKLIGSPQYIHTFKEIETLIEIIDDVSLVNSYLEQVALPL